MFAIIFEVRPKPGRMKDYLDLAAMLRPELEKIDGFVSVERFSSLSDQGKLLSVSFWRDEEAIRAWRTHEQHRLAQMRGRTDVFEDYRIRVVEVVRDYSMTDRAQVPS